MTELLFEDQGTCTLIQIKSTVTKKILAWHTQVPMGITEKSYTMTISKFKATVFNNFFI